MIIFSLIAAACAALSNLFIRKSSLKHAASSPFLFYYYLFSFIGTFLFQTQYTMVVLDYKLLLLGCCAGILNVALMMVTSRSLKYNSSGLTFTFQNAATVFPHLVLFLMFGSSFGFITSIYEVCGVLLIILGLFFGIFKNSESNKKSAKSIFYVLGCFLIQITIMSIFQGRTLLIESNDAGSSDFSFMIGFFGMALFTQLVNFLRVLGSQEMNKSHIIGSVLLYGCVCGIANAASTYFLLRASLGASSSEGGLIFPLFAVAVIILCNVWGYLLYHEPPKAPTIAFCSSGIFVASMGL